MNRRHEAILQLAAWAPAVLIGTLLALLLNREIFEGQMQSHDTLQYASALWGIAHGDFLTSALSAHVFSLHGHFLFPVLAPFTKVMPAAEVLLIAQSAALSVTLFLVARFFQFVARERGGPVSQVALIGLWGAALSVILTPLVLNPFFFDPRPDFLAFPFIVAGFLRAVRRGGFDGGSLALLILGALGREEFALIIASAYLLFGSSASSAPGTWTRRKCWIAAAVFATYFVVYFLGISPWFGRSGWIDAGAMLGGKTDQLFGAHDATLSATLIRKLEILLVFATSAGGLVWFGFRAGAWRWLLVALVGSTLILVSRFRLDLQLNFHYALFAGPALIAAAAASFRHYAMRPGRLPRWHLFLWSAIGVASFALEASAPGGRRFAARNFDLVDESGHLTFTNVSRNPGFRAIHARLAEIPRHHGVVVPYRYGAPLADRKSIISNHHFKSQMIEGRALPPGIDSVVVLPREITSMGRQLVMHHGFKLSGFMRGPIEVVTRAPQSVSIPWGRLGARPLDGKCQTPETTWPAAGIALCNSRVENGEILSAWFARTGNRVGAESPATVLPVFAATPTNAVTASAPTPLWAANGLVNLRDLPVGWAIELRSEQPVALTNGEFRLFTADGREVTSVRDYFFGP